jgi:hypothetical protein
MPAPSAGPDVEMTKASGGATLHQLRHSKLTHEAEDGTSTPVLMAAATGLITAVAAAIRATRVR